MSVWWQVHLFAPVTYNYRATKKQVVKLLLDAGFSVGTVKSLYEQETETAHVVISCNTIEDMEE